MRDKLPCEKLPRLSREREGMQAVDGNQLSNSGLIYVCKINRPQ